MQQRTFTAKDVAGALALVKRELGGEAMIISTRSVRGRSILGFPGKPAVEIVAALPSGADLPGRARHTPMPRVETPPKDDPASSRSAPVRAAADRATRAAAAAGEPARPVSASIPDIRDQPPRIAASPAPAKPPQPTARPSAERAKLADLVAAPTSRPVTTAPPPAAPTPALQHELASLRALVGQVLHNTQRTAVAIGRQGGETGLAAAGISPADPLFEAYAGLLDASVPAEIADELIATVRSELTPAELADSGILRQTLLRAIAAEMPVASAVPTRGQRRIALLGPTGVGKTTTIAKLAATFHLRQGKSVALITADTYRIAAVEQLRTYAGLIGVPLRVATDAEQMSAARDAFASADVVLIDTAGRSHRDAARIAELAELAELADPHERHLVLSSGTPERAQRAIVERFAAAGADRVIATKLDEAVGLGGLLSIARITGLPLSYVTTGQEVPQDIQPATADRLARYVLEQPERFGQDVSHAEREPATDRVPQRTAVTA